MADSEDSSELFGKIFSVPSSQQGTREEQSVGQVSLVEKNIGEVIRTITSNIDIFGTSQISESQVNITQANRTKVNIPQCSLSQVSSIQNGISQISSSQIGSDQIGISQIGASQITVPNFSDRSSSQISFSEVKIVQTQVTQIESDQIGSGEIRLTTGNKNLNLSEGRSESVVNIFPIFHLSDAPQILFSLQSTTIDIWSDLLKAKTSLNFTFNITNLPSGQLAEGTITSYNTNGTPKTATINIDDDANGVGWFLDTTPQDNSEFRPGDMGSGGLGDYYIADPNSAASGKYDLLTAILHEMGHTLGIINGYSEFDKHVKNGIFITDTFTTKLTPDSSHLDSTLYPYDLMNTSLKPGVRKLPSTMDWAILNAINSGVGTGILPSPKMAAPATTSPTPGTSATAPTPSPDKTSPTPTPTTVTTQSPSQSPKTTEPAPPQQFKSPSLTLPPPLPPWMNAAL
jgi:large repetitive protein